MNVVPMSLYLGLCQAARPHRRSVGIPRSDCSLIWRFGGVTGLLGARLCLSWRVNRLKRMLNQFWAPNLKFERYVLVNHFFRMKLNFGLEVFGQCYFLEWQGRSPFLQFCSVDDLKSTSFASGAIYIKWARFQGYQYYEQSCEIKRAEWLMENSFDID